jgi:hypothetical protein
VSSYSFRVESLEELIRRREETADQIRKAFRAAAWDSALATRLIVSKDSPVDTGDYKSSWRAVKNDIRGGVDLINDAPHAGIIEQGARPHMPPLQPLIDWARRKAADIGLVQLATGKQYGGPSSLNQDQDAAVIRFARAIQHKIAAQGQAPLWIMRKRLPFARKFLMLSFERQLERIAAGGKAKS